MNPINRKQFDHLVRKQLAYCHPLIFLDEYKIGLHVEPIVSRMAEEIDLLKGIKLDELERVDLSKAPIVRGTTYLGLSVQKISLPDNVIGRLHTRSTLSRLGLDFFGSSTYVSPGFGAEVPTQMVFEITPSVTIRNLPLNQPVAGLVLYQLDGVEEVWRGRGRHSKRFPFTDLRPVRDDE